MRSTRVLLRAGVTDCVNRTSQYSGLQRFKNLSLLFVNVGGDTYENLFHVQGDDTVIMDWFAQDRMKPDSNAVLELLKPNAKVFLFLRFIGGAYLCCGGLELVSWDASATPIKFKWKVKAKRLLDKVPAWVAMTTGGQDDGPIVKKTS